MYYLSELQDGTPRVSIGLDRYVSSYLLSVVVLTAITSSISR